MRRHELLRGSYEIRCEHWTHQMRWRWRCLKDGHTAHSLATNDQPDPCDYNALLCRKRFWLWNRFVFCLRYVDGRLVSINNSIRIMCAIFVKALSTCRMQIVIWLSQARDVWVQQMTTFDVSTLQDTQSARNRKKWLREDHIHRIILIKFSDQLFFLLSSC